MDKRRLVFSMVQFLNRELASDDLSEDAKEGLEVASQCLQTAYCLGPEDVHLEVRQPLDEIFSKATINEPLKRRTPPTESEKDEAERLKVEGNELMRQEQFEAAIEKYNKALELDSSNQVFYCNRAAAFSKLNNHFAAVEDCQRAIDMDPTYSKAYGRMGLANSSLFRHREAVECFKKALELEPDNESYRNNLRLAEEKLSAGGSPGAARAAFPAFPGAGEMSALLSDPNLMNMATSVMSNPNVQQLMGQLMSGGLGSPNAGGGGGMEGLLQAGQRLAEQMQQTNPELVEQLRRQMGLDPSMGGPPFGRPGNDDDNNSGNSS